MHSMQFWTSFKALPCTAKLLNLSKKPSITAFIKSKIITIVTQLSKPSHSMIAPPQIGHANSFIREHHMEENKMSYGAAYDYGQEDLRR